MSQVYKSIYFNDFPSDISKNKSITVAFNNQEIDVFNKIQSLSNEDIRALIGLDSYEKIKYISEKEERSVNQIIKRKLKHNLSSKDIIFDKKDITYLNSKIIPFQKWYPYIEGYSPDFVKNIISQYCLKAKNIYDPFVGTGTSIFAADEFNIKCLYSEVNPLLVFMTSTKVRILKLSKESRIFLSQRLLQISKNLFSNLENIEPDYILKKNYDLIFSDSHYFENHTFESILRLRTYVDKISIEEDELLSDIVCFGIISALLPVSFLKKVGDVRFKTDTELEKDPPRDMMEYLINKLNEMAEDIANISIKLNKDHEFLLYNAKNINKLYGLEIDAVITSPPYLNGTNYFRNTKLELWFLKYIQDNDDLRYFRDQALTSGINDVSKSNAVQIEQSDIKEKSILLKSTILKLSEQTYDKRITLMVESYFIEMKKIFEHLHSSLNKSSKVFIDIGDSVFAGVHVQTDKILVEVLGNIGYSLLENKLLRKRRSRDNSVLSQNLLIFEKTEFQHNEQIENFPWIENWNYFKNNLPHQKEPFAKRNWGHTNHSLCSYQGKLKPSIAFSLINTFCPRGGRLLDTFSGVGTIPFEAALNNRMAYGFDISLPAYFISTAKVSKQNITECNNIINQLENYILNNEVNNKELSEVINFGYNKKIVDYFDTNTLNEIILARRYFQINKPATPGEMLIISSLLHILHGNRPYALSRRSHPIVPYAPTGDFIYKNLIEHLKDKVNKTLSEELPNEFIPGKVFLQDSTKVWPQEVSNLDAIITSPPFFDSTRFYLANWMRLWFSGWSKYDFEHKASLFLEEKQKNSFSIYENLFRQAKERLNENGVLVLHLGKSVKCDMAEELLKIGKRWFKEVDLFDESVIHCESHGIKDKGTVTSHQYLILN